MMREVKSYLEKLPGDRCVSIHFRNIYEYVGAVMVFFGSVFQPLIDVCITDKNKDENN